MDKYCIVTTIVANLYKKPSFTSELVTQALIKEKLLILDNQDNWYKVKQWDSYESWIHKFYIKDLELDSSIGWNKLDINKTNNILMCKLHPSKPKIVFHYCSSNSRR